MRTTILRGPRRWDLVGPVWRKLLADDLPRSVFQTAEWAEALAEEAHDDRARWVVAEDDDGPLAVVPLALRVRRKGPVRLRVLTNERTSDAVLAGRADPRRIRAGLLAAMAAEREPVDLLSLGGLRSGSGFARLATAAARGLRTEHRRGGHALIGTTEPYDEWLAAAGRNLRAGLRKARNRCEGRGELAVTTASDAAGVAAAFDEFVAIEASAGRRPAARSPPSPSTAPGSAASSWRPRRRAAPPCARCGSMGGRRRPSSPASRAARSSC